ncbi:MAG TPA: tripartite tricarboxylate transporter substrate binding protein [Burkholderiales bacterium]
MALTARCAAAVVLVLLGSAVFAQPYPARPVRVIVTFPPGAGSDISTRLVTAKLSETFGRPFVIDNRAGAAGNIGVELAAHAAPDGYTLLAVTASAAISQSAYAKVPFDLATHFSPIALIASAPFILAVHPAIPAKSLQELIALAKSKPGQLSYATPGTGSSPHLAGELLKMEVGIDLLHVPYKGTVPAVADVMGGNVSMALANTLVALPHVKAGRLRGIAITSARRSTLVPELPTIAESAVRGFEAGTWYGLLAPAGAPREIVSRLNRAVVQIVQLPDVREKLAAQGAEPLAGSPEQAGEFVRREISRWAKVVKAANIRLD